MTKRLPAFIFLCLTLCFLCSLSSSAAQNLSLDFASYGDVIAAYSLAVSHPEALTEEALWELAVEPFLLSAEQTGSMLRDLDRDGTDELLIMDRPHGYGDGNGSVYVIFALGDDGRPRHVADGWSRSRLYLLEDGTLLCEGSSGAAYSTIARYEWTAAGLRYLEGYASSDYTASDGTQQWGWFASPDGECTQDTRLLTDEDEIVPWAERLYDAVVADDSGWKPLVAP